VGGDGRSCEVSDRFDVNLRIDPLPAHLGAYVGVEQVDRGGVGGCRGHHGETPSNQT